MDELLTVKEAARLLQVGVSSVKRWADGGLLACERTPGHHRRFRRSVIEALLQQRRAEPFAEDASMPPGRSLEALVDVLLGVGSSDAIDALLAAERRRLGAWGGAADAIAPTVHEIGELWARGTITVLQEHVASERLARGLARASESLPWAADARVALLVTAEGEEHTLGLSLAEVVLREAGWNVSWGGRRTPIDEVRAFSKGRQLDLLAVSASVVSSDAAFLSRQAEALAAVCRPAGIDLVLGGRGAWPDPPPWGVRLHDFASLASFLARNEETR